MCMRLFVHPEYVRTCVYVVMGVEGGECLFHCTWRSSPSWSTLALSRLASVSFGWWLTGGRNGLVGGGGVIIIIYSKVVGWHWIHERCKNHQLNEINIHANRPGVAIENGDILPLNIKFGFGVLVLVLFQDLSQRLHSQTFLSFVRVHEHTHTHTQRTHAVRQADTISLGVLLVGVASEKINHGSLPQPAHLCLCTKVLAPHQVSDLVCESVTPAPGSQCFFLFSFSVFFP